MVDGEVGSGVVRGGGVLIESRPDDSSLSKNNLYKNIYRIFSIIKNVLIIKNNNSRGPFPSFQEHV